MTRRDEQIRRILQEIERGAATSHRSISARAGLSLGLTNQLLRSLLHRRFVRVVEVAANRRQYLLTPLGQKEQRRIAREYLQMAVGHYLEVCESLRGRFEELSRDWPSPAPHRRIILYGSGCLADVASACAQTAGLTVVSLVDDTCAAPSAGRGADGVGSRSRTRGATDGFDGVVVVASQETRTVRTWLKAGGIPANRVLWL